MMTREWLLEVGGCGVVVLQVRAVVDRGTREEISIFSGDAMVHRARANLVLSRRRIAVPRWFRVILWV